MNSDKHNLMSVLKQKFVYIFLVAVVLALLALIISMLQPAKYRVRTSYLVVQKQAESMDAYAAARSSEKIAMNFSRIIKTDSFFAKVLATNFDVQDDWPADSLDKRKAWSKTVETSVTGDDAILTVDVYHTDSVTAREISKGIAYVLINQSSEYHGAGNLINVKIIDSPLASKRPVKPNYLVNILGAFVLGMVASSGFIIYSYQIKKEESVSNEMNISSMNDHDFDQKYYQED